MDVRSLSVVVVGARGDACRALVSRVRVRVRDEARAGGRDVRATLGALALADLAPRAGLWRERLRMRTARALDVHYRRCVYLNVQIFKIYWFQMKSYFCVR